MCKGPMDKAKVEKDLGWAVGASAVGESGQKMETTVLEQQYKTNQMSTLCKVPGFMIYRINIQTPHIKRTIYRKLQKILFFVVYKSHGIKS